MDEGIDGLTVCSPVDFLQVAAFVIVGVARECYGSNGLAGRWNDSVLHVGTILNGGTLGSGIALVVGVGKPRVKKAEIKPEQPAGAVTPEEVMEDVPPDDDLPF